MVLKTVLKIYTYIFIALLYIPLIVMVLFSFSDSRFIGVWGGFTLRWYYELIHRSDVWTSLWNSIMIAIPCAIISIILGMLTAYAMRIGIVKGKLCTTLDFVMYIPIVIPEIAEAFSLAVFFYILMKLGLPIEYGALTVFIGHVAFNISFAYVGLKKFMDMLSPNLEYAAYTLGANVSQTFVKVIVPISLPAIATTFLITFILSFDNFIKTAFTTGPGFKTLPLLIWSAVGRGRGSPLINALGVLMLSVSLVVAIIYARQIAKYYVTMR